MIEAPLRVQKKGMIFNMSCLCNLFDNEVIWLIIIALLILNFTCNGGCCCGTQGTYGGGYNGGCGCGCN